jgi:AcrR family transcriptional regulator
VARSRAAVIAATLELLAVRGVAGTTIEAVAERSGVAKTTIYRQWADQPALVRDAFATTLAAPAVPDTGALRTDLLQLADGLARALSSGPAAALTAALLEAAERDPAYAELHRREARQRHEALRAVVRRAAARGELTAGADADVALDLLAGPLFHRRWMTGGAIDAGFTATVVDATLAALPARAAGGCADEPMSR